MFVILSSGGHTDCHYYLWVWFCIIHDSPGFLTLSSYCLRPALRILISQNSKKVGVLAGLVGPILFFLMDVAV